MAKMLILGEKPSQVMDYAKTLGFNKKEDGFLEGNKYVYTWAYGHLMQLKKPAEYSEKWKEWNLDNLPIVPDEFELKVIDNPGAKKQFNVIKKLIKRDDIDSICISTDCAREGEAIARYIIDYIGTNKPKYRLWIDSLEEEDIRKGFKNLRPLHEFDNLYESAKARSQLDYILGLSFTRAYTIKKADKILLSVGRVQTPVLNLVVERDLEIENFKFEKFYELENEFDKLKAMLVLENKILDKKEIEKIKNEIQGKNGVVEEIEKQEKSTNHPLLFNLTNLQRAMNRKHGYSAKKTLDLMQKLYEKKILTYPRTSSRHITESIFETVPTIIEKLKFDKFKEYANYCLNLDKLPVTNRIVDNSKVTDHTAIIPTKNSDIEKIYINLSEDEKNVFDEVALSFLACFFGKYKYESTKIIITVDNYKFITRGKKNIDLGWKKVYKDEEEANNNEYSIEDKINENDILKFKKINILEKKTKPKPKFTEDKLLEIMENPKNLIEEEYLKKAIIGYGIGCESTRAGIIELLIKREYLEREKKNLVSTEKGKKLIGVIETEELKKAELTATWEQNLKEIEIGKKDKDEFMKETIEFIKVGIEKLKNSNDSTLITNAEKESLGKCKECDGEIKENKIGYGCSNWKQGCKFTILKDNKFIDKKITKALAKRLLEDKDKEYYLFKNEKEYWNVYNKKAESLGKCKECNGEIKENKIGYGCSNWKQGCKFTILKENKFIDKKITKAFAKRLLEDKDKEYYLIKNDKGYWNIYKKK